MSELKLLVQVRTQGYIIFWINLYRNMYYVELTCKRFGNQYTTDVYFRF